MAIRHDGGAGSCFTQLIPWLVRSCLAAAMVGTAVILLRRQQRQPADRPTMRGCRHPPGRDRPSRTMAETAGVLPPPRTRRSNRCPKAAGFRSDRRDRRRPTPGCREQGFETRAARAHGSAPERPRRSAVATIRIAGTVPASPLRSRAVWDGRQPLQPPLRRPGAMHLSWRAKRLRFGRHRVAALPHHCRPQGFPRPPCPSPENRTRGGGRRHGASDTPRQRER